MSKTIEPRICVFISKTILWDQIKSYPLGSDVPAPDPSRQRWVRVHNNKGGIAMNAETLAKLESDDPLVWKEAMKSVIMNMTEDECKELLALWKGMNLSVAIEANAPTQSARQGVRKNSKWLHRRKEAQNRENDPPPWIFSPWLLARPFGWSP